MSETATQQNGWREVKLGEVCSDISYGYTASAKNDPVGPKFLRITDIVPDRINWKDVPYCGIDNKNAKKYKLDMGDIVIARTGATTGYNKTIKSKVNAVFASYLIRYKINPSIAYAFYVGHALQSPYWKNFVEGVAGGSAQPGANAKQFASFVFNLPPLPEQKAIAEVLSSLDDKIDLLHRQNKTLENMAHALFRKWFVEEAYEGWEKKSLGEVVDISIGRTPPRKEFKWFSKRPEDIKWISIKDMGDNGVYIFDTSEYLTKEAVRKFNIPTIPGDTVVLSFKMTVGRVGITTEEMLSNEAIAQFKFNTKTPFSKEYLYLYLKTFKFDSLGSTSSIVTSINSSMIKEILIAMPDHETMNKFQETSEQLFKRIFLNQSQIRTLGSLRDTLLPRLMRGSVRVRF